MLGLSVNPNYYMFNGMWIAERNLLPAREYKGHDVTKLKQYVQCIYIYSCQEGMIMKEHTSYFATRWGWRMRKTQGFRKQINELIAMVKVIEESCKKGSRALVNTINEETAPRVEET